MKKDVSKQIAEASDERTPVDVLLEISKTKNREVKSALAKNPSIIWQEDQGYNTKIMEKLADQFPDEIFFSNPSFILHAILERSGYMVSVVEKVASAIRDTNALENIFLMYGEYRDVARSIVTNPNSSEDLLRSVYQKTNSNVVRLQLAICKRTPKDILRKIGNPLNSTRAILTNVAANENADAETLYLLSTKDPEIREQVALNPNTPSHVLEFLGDEKTEKIVVVRESVAFNKNCPQHILWRLGNYKEESSDRVRIAAVKNPSMARGSLIQIARFDPNEAVRKAASRAMSE